MRHPFMLRRLRPLILGGLLACGAVAVRAGEPSGYRLPPAPIPEILDAAPTPAVSVDRQHRRLAILGRENLPTIAALAEPVLRLAGYRINPRNNGPGEARSAWLNSVTLEDIGDGSQRRVRLPDSARFIDPSWSPDGHWLALALDTPAGLELWLVATDSGDAHRVGAGHLNAAFGRAYRWLPDSAGLIVCSVVAARGAPPAGAAAPGG
ncbi:MAG: hypothetical protein QM617_09660, partial [Comamonas sp.]